MMQIVHYSLYLTHQGWNLVSCIIYIEMQDFLKNMHEDLTYGAHRVGFHQKVTVMSNK